MHSSSLDMIWLVKSMAVTCPAQVLLPNSAGRCRCWPPHRMDARSPCCARGFSVGLLVGLVGAGLAVAKPETVRAAGRTFGIIPP